ncbi:hypothetical protein CC78DRAFT_525125 [Lojkania enalia]|uniref:Cytochrome b-c1 complex subunit 8 n=1 Tax=Lojkania enalia TaxID=147567 RepID=A0A9P4K368_9PLEO|nr:hypothetical protein CC78DRAFT_525125 [Didymosphaeria enalia]
MFPNRQRPFTRAIHNTFFNIFRRARTQNLYWVPPVIVTYYSMSWAIERSELAYFGDIRTVAMRLVGNMD